MIRQGLLLLLLLLLIIIFINKGPIKIRCGTVDYKSSNHIISKSSVFQSYKITHCNHSIYVKFLIGLAIFDANL